LRKALSELSRRQVFGAGARFRKSSTFEQRARLSDRRLEPSLMLRFEALLEA
jgi:hypothetical protein